MDNNQPAQNGSLQVELAPEVAGGIYTNLSIVSHSPTEMVIDFVRMFPGMSKAKVVSRIVLAPENAKRLFLALQDNIIKYEKTYRKINLPAPPASNNSRTANPFGVPEGEA